jgi:WD repeat-containing protein 19
MASTAHEFASILMRPEYRAQIDARHRKRIEGVVRNYDSSSRVDDESALGDASPCPHCGFTVPLAELECRRCRNVIPYCIASVRSIQRSLTLLTL